MNVYDTANKLANEIKESEEYANYKIAKQTLKLNSELKGKIEKFDKLRYELQLEMMQTGKNNEEKNAELQKEYSELIKDPEAKKFFETETKFNILIADVNKIIGEAIREVMQ